MATKAEKDAAKKLDAAKVMLAAIVAATNDDRGCLYTSPEVHAPLIAEGLVEINEAYKNEAGEIATRATKKGMELIMNNAANANSAGEVVKASTTYAIANVPMPESTSRRGGRSGSVYPFDKLEVGQSFFVPASEKHPEPAKSLGSTVSGATARFAHVVKDETGAEVKEEKVVALYKVDEAGKRVKENGKFVKLGEEKRMVPKMKTTKEFKLQAVENGEAWGFPGVKGAGIWRTK